MKTLKNHIILYDAECPMCNLYTHAFTTTGMLDPTGRAPYQNIPDFACPLIDRQRAVNEIALIDKTTGEVRYGIDSLFAIIGTSFPIFKPLFASKAFHWTMRKLYAFISYNRKVIIPAPKGDTHTIQPSFKLHYRIAWLLFTTLIASLILGHNTPLLLIPALVAIPLATKRRWDYLGNLATVNLAGALLLWPMLALTPRIPKPIPATYVLLIATLMLGELIRRTRLILK
jgi:hypothetical protein